MLYIFIHIDTYGMCHIHMYTVPQPPSPRCIHACIDIYIDIGPFVGPNERGSEVK